MPEIIIEGENIGKIRAEVTDENPRTAERFLKILPITGKVHLWGDEIYFRIPIEKIEPENPRVVVKEGEIGIWIAKPSLCIFFGKTPMSTDKEIRAYSEVNVIARVVGNYGIFKRVKDGEEIRVSHYGYRPEE